MSKYSIAFRFTNLRVACESPDVHIMMIYVRQATSPEPHNIRMNVLSANCSPKSSVSLPACCACPASGMHPARMEIPTCATLFMQSPPSAWSIKSHAWAPEPGRSLRRENDKRIRRCMGCCRSRNGRWRTSTWCVFRPAISPRKPFVWEMCAHGGRKAWMKGVTSEVRGVWQEPLKPLL